MINGVGGAFIFSQDAAQLAQWYTEKLDLTFEGSAEFGAFYIRYEALDPRDPERILDTTFSIMQAKRPIPEMERQTGTEQGDMYGDQPFMINLRVDDLDALLAKLRERGVEPLRRDDEGYGIFAWVRDADGNRIELYQPRTQAEVEADS